MTAPTYYDASAPSEEPLPAVATTAQLVAPECVFFAPRTRRGHGPGIICLMPPQPAAIGKRTPGAVQPSADLLLAEEGFAVVCACINDGEHSLTVEDALQAAAGTMEKQGCVDEKAKIAVLVFGDQRILDSTLELLPQYPQVVCLVAYDVQTASSPVPTLVHLAASSQQMTTAENTITHVYSGTDHHFYDPGLQSFKPSATAIAHTRTTSFLKKHLGGPHFDLERIWDEHCVYEFQERSVAKTMGTMVEEPYVNHVPTMTGGIGREKLTAFYRDHFIFKNPRDAALELVSRTVGSDRIVDEFIFHLTHDTAVDWLLPGMAPTGKKLAIPMVAVVHIRGDRLAHEHIWWDQAGALLQAGLLPERAPVPGASGDAMLRLPVAGAAAARLVVDETDGVSNEMLTKAWQEAL